MSRRPGRQAAMPRVRTLRLASLDDIERARAVAGWLDRPSLDRVRVELPWTGRRERAEAARKLRTLFNDCGCPLGAIAFLAVLVAALIAWTPQAGLTWSVTGRSLALAVPAAVAGKLLGLGWSRWRLHAWLDRLALRPHDSAGDATRNDPNGER